MLLGSKCDVVTTQHKMRVSDIRTRADVKNWLLEELTLAPKVTPRKVTIKGDSSWEVVAGFRRAFHRHEVFFNTASNQYAFHVSEFEELSDFPNIGTYSSYDEMIDGAVDHFASMWNVSSSLKIDSIAPC